MVRSALVTGHAGLIGQHLYATLQSMGVEVQGIGRQTHKDGVLNKEILHPLIAGRDTVFHLAANPSVWVAQTQPVQDCELNVIGSLNVIEGCLKFGAKMIFPSTIQVYAMPEQEGSILSENSKVEPVEFYGVSKLAVENYMRVFRRQANLRGDCAKITLGLRQRRKEEERLVV